MGCGCLDTVRPRLEWESKGEVTSIWKQAWVEQEEGCVEVARAVRGRSCRRERLSLVKIVG